MKSTGLGGQSKSTQAAPTKTDDLPSMESSQFTPTVYPGGGSPRDMGSGSTTMNYAPTQKSEGRFDQAWDAWSQKMAQPGLSPSERLQMKNAAQVSAQGQQQTQQQQLTNQLQNQGLTGGGFADAQLASLRGQQAGDLQNTLSGMDMQNAMLGDRNTMSLIGQGADMASQYGQLGYNYSNLNNDARNQQLDWQRYFHQQYQDELARRYMEQDRRRESDMIDPPKVQRAPWQPGGLG